MDDEGAEDKKALNMRFQKTDSRNKTRGEALHTALEKEETLKTIINNSQVVLFLRKNENKWPVEFVSENVANFGYMVEDFTSGRVMYRDIIYPDDLEKIEKELEKRVKSADSAFNMEYRIFTKSRDIRWINERTFIQRNTDGKITHFQG
ncbi:MAG: PAS domain-containing protein [Methanosarcina barkeri]|nr:PAS domain-containing protein [Methanosarcina sp. ERenArc_MAG2]